MLARVKPVQFLPCVELFRIDPQLLHVAFQRRHGFLRVTLTEGS